MLTCKNNNQPVNLKALLVLLPTGGVHDGLLMPRYLRMHMCSLVSSAVLCRCMHAQLALPVHSHHCPVFAIKWKECM